MSKNITSKFRKIEKQINNHSYSKQNFSQIQHVNKMYLHIQDSFNMIGKNRYTISKWRTFENDF